MAAFPVGHCSHSNRFVVFLLILLVFHPVYGDVDQVKAEDLINSILSNETLYNHNIRPRGDNGSATFVVVNLFLRNIGTIGESSFVPNCCNFPKFYNNCCINCDFYL